MSPDLRLAGLAVGAWLAALAGLYLTARDGVLLGAGAALGTVLAGWLLRGLHHYTAHAMNVLLVLHLMQVVIDGAYKAPREVNFWFGIILLLLVMALSLKA